jgi:Bacteriophage probable baseplate hub protein
MPPDFADAPQTPLAHAPSVALQGQVNVDVSEGILAMRIEEDVEGLYQCELELGNWGPVGQAIDFLYFDRQTIDFGMPLDVKLGSDTLFSGTITALEGGFPEGSPPVISVLAEDGLQEFRMTRRTRTFESVTDVSVFNQVAGEHGLATDVQAPGPTYRVLTQLAQSDLAFLRERARSIDAELWIDSGTLKVRPRASRNTATASLSYGRDLRSMTVIADLAGQRSDLTVSGWDVAAKAAISEASDDGVLGSELNGDTSGASILAAALSARHENVAHAVPLSTDEARARSQALYRQAARRFLRGHCIAETSAQLQVGAHLTVDGLGDLFTGQYYVSHAVHRYNRKSGLQTELTLERPGLGSPPA